MASISSAAKSGFTLIEVLLVVSIMSLMSGFLLVYTRGSENQIKLMKDKAGFLGALYRARSLSLRTLQSTPPECGYGIYILDEKRYVLWRDTATKADCTDANHEYDSPAEAIEPAQTLSMSLKFKDFGASDVLRSILFVPPDPKVITEPPLAMGEQARVVIAIQNGNSEAEIRINRFGQIEPGVGY